MTISRRDVLTTLATLPALTMVGSASSQTTTDASYASRAAADEWMLTWMPKGATAGGLFVMRFADGYFALTKKIGWSPEQEDEPLPAVKVPSMFVTDFASIPRLFWTLIPKDGQYTYAAVIHDYLYWNQATSREEADKIFRAAMKEFKVSALTMSTIYKAIRLGGQSAWDENARAKAAGESRVLTRLPDDPKVKWADWKVVPGVFG